MAIVETVKVKWPDNVRAGYAVINTTDFDPDKHEIFQDGNSEPDGGDAYAGIDDAELRARIEQATGERPHHKTRRSTLVDMAKEAGI